MKYTSAYQLSDGSWRCSIVQEFHFPSFPQENDMQLEELISDINSEGFHVSNLFQTRDRSWQANLRTANGYLQQEYGCGNTPYLALMEALTKMQAPKPKKILSVATAQTGSSLLASLGLKKPAVVS